MSQSSLERSPNSPEPSYQRHAHVFAEEGSAFLQLARPPVVSAAAAVGAASRVETQARPGPTPVPARSEPYEVIVIGAGQAGLSVGYHLKKAGVRFVILDANHRVGDVWRQRWDSLRLFTPARYDGLVGMPFPAPPDSFPTKDEMADYLEAYARRFELPVENCTRVERLSQERGRYAVMAGGRRYETRQVVVAMATYQKPRIPAFAAELGRRVLQLHSSEYRNESPLRDGDVLIVGAGNSGAEIALECARRHPTWLSGRSTGHLPFRFQSFARQKVLLPVLLRFLFHRVFTLDNPIGRKLRPKLIGKGGPLIRVRPAELAAAGVKRCARLAGVRDGKPVLEGGQVLDVANVIWATGFRPGFSWIDLPVLDEHDDPKGHVRGVVQDSPGLYFVGSHFLYAFSSTMIHGVARDAEHIAQAILRRAGEAVGTAAAGTRS